MRQRECTFRKPLSSDCLIFLVVAGLILICGTATAASPDASVVAPTDGWSNVPAAGIFYELAPGSNFFQGCVGPCMCPVQDVGQIEGTFDLVPIHPTPLFTRYAMTEIYWTVIDSEGIIHRIRGNGIYEIGGEALLMQQMTLFLSIDKRQPVIFDSGLIPATSRFPHISIEVDRGSKCYDLWMIIEADPQN